MKMRMLPLVVLAWFGAGCAPAGPPGAPQPEAPTATRMVYTSPTPTVLLYDVMDSTTSEIQAGPAGTVNVVLGSHGTAELRVEPDSIGQTVTVDYTEFSGSFSNSAGGGTVTATESDVKTPATLKVAPTGTAEVVRQPELTAQFIQVAGSESPFRRFFVPLPSEPVRPGAVWVDTLTTNESVEGVNTTTINVITATYARDTTIAGRRMNYISYTAARTVNARGTTQGVEIAQKLDGNATGYFIWDPAQNTLYERDESISMTGGFDLPALGLTGLPITARGRARVQLKANS